MGTRPAVGATGGRPYGWNPLRSHGEKDNEA